MSRPGPSGRRRILVVLGTRPEAIKLAPVIKAMKCRQEFETRVCVTAQHREMLDPFLALFHIIPDVDLDVMRPGQDLTDVTVAVLSGMRQVLRDNRPDWVIVQGDTTTVLATCLAAFYEQVAVAHVEAGLRTGNIHMPYPEEMNRRVASCLASLHFAPTPRAKQALLHENIPENTIHVTGNTVIDALFSVVQRLRDDAPLKAALDREFSWLDPRRKMILVTGHRRESFGPGFEQICLALTQLSRRPDVQLVYPVHLNPHVREPVNRLLGSNPSIHLLDPLDYVPFVYLMDRCHMIITDSGGIQEEAPSLGKPVLVMRDVTERPEAVATGTVKLVGAHAARIAAAVELLDDPSVYRQMARSHNPYGDGRAAERISAILSSFPDRPPAHEDNFDSVV
ncbi:MAG: UDP-N-acetylglucosamine 2-epimerase (non-hydrolyzing) [Deltaproteobacteria bacterium]|nr:UDP-N-acetylglucosamine 2-epimerase (non-hydrolyzing) [Deltaproteobacteria bacterium]